MPMGYATTLEVSDAISIPHCRIYSIVLLSVSSQHLRLVALIWTTCAPHVKRLNEIALVLRFFPDMHSKFEQKSRFLTWHRRQS